MLLWPPIRRGSPFRIIWTCWTLKQSRRRGYLPFAFSLLRLEGNSRFWKDACIVYPYTEDLHVRMTRNKRDMEPQGSCGDSFNNSLNTCKIWGNLFTLFQIFQSHNVRSRLIAMKRLDKYVHWAILRPIRIDLSAVSALSGISCRTMLMYHLICSVLPHNFMDFSVIQSSALAC